MAGGSMPWVAVDPTTARLYTAKFNDTKLRVYQIVNPGPQVQFEPLPDIPLRLPPSFNTLPEWGASSGAIGRAVDEREQ